MVFRRDPDAALIRRIANGDESAAETFVTQKLHRVLAIAYRICGNQTEAEDIAQDVFVRVWKYARSWNTDQAKVDTWLHRIVLNVCHDRLAYAHRSQEVTGLPLGDVIDSAPTPEDVMVRQSIRTRVWKSIMVLPARQREALVLTYYQDMTNVEAAAAMGISVDAVESLISRARRALRQCLLDVNK